jgi:hypothetical protein
MTTKEGATEGARELAHEHYHALGARGYRVPDCWAHPDEPCDVECDHLTAAIEARDAALLERAARACMRLAVHIDPACDGDDCACPKCTVAKACAAEVRALTDQPEGTPTTECGTRTTKGRRA